MLTPIVTPPPRLTATFFPDGKTLKTLVSNGVFSRSIHTLSDKADGSITVVCHSGCPDGSWSGAIVEKSLAQRQVQQLLQSYPMASPEVEVNLLQQHKAMEENATIMTADIMFEMATVLELLKRDATTRLIQTDHHGGSGKKFLEAYNALDAIDRAIINDAIDCGRLVVNIDTTQSGASHIFNLLNKEKTTEQLQAMFDCPTDSQLSSYRQFMKSYDLTTMQPAAVRELTKFAAEQVVLDRGSQSILNTCLAGIDNQFIKDNLIHFLLCYVTDCDFNGKFHFASPDSDRNTVVAPSFFDLDDPSYPGGRANPNHKILMKVPENTKTFVSQVLEYCKDINKALKEVNAEAFIAQVNEVTRVLNQGQPVTFAGEHFFAANITTRRGRFVQTLVSDVLKKHPDCQYAVLFDNKYNVSLVRPLESTLDLTETVKPWLNKHLIHSGGGHPEAVGMQMVGENQYANLLHHCHKVGIPLNDQQLKVVESFAEGLEPLLVK